MDPSLGNSFFLSRGLKFFLVISVDPDQVLRYVASGRSLQCSPMPLFCILVKSFKERFHTVIGTQWIVWDRGLTFWQNVLSERIYFLVKCKECGSWSNVALVLPLLQYALTWHTKQSVEHVYLKNLIPWHPI